MSAISATLPDERVSLAAGRRVAARRRWVATAVASLFFGVGWLFAWITPPAVVALARACGRGARWCAAAVAVGRADALARIDEATVGRG